MMTRDSFSKQLLAYDPVDQSEQEFKQQFLDLLTDPKCYSRELLHGHLTASAWITDESCSQILLLHHRKLDRWLQPGGHADGDEDLLAVAIKEMQEETGVTEFEIPEQHFFDIDIHQIPERKKVPAHDHYDVRYHFVVNETHDIKQNEESMALKWFKVDDVPEIVKNEVSIIRMIRKTKGKLVQ